MKLLILIVAILTFVILGVIGNILNILEDREFGLYIFIKNILIPLLSLCYIVWYFVEP